MVGAAGRDVDRHVADQAHAALGGVRAQRGPLALEAHLVVDRPRRRRRRPPSRRSRTRGARGSVALGAPTPARRARPGARATPRTPTPPCRASAGDRAARAAASATTTGPPRRASRRTRSADAPSRPARQRGEMQLDAAGSWKSHVVAQIGGSGVVPARLPRPSRLTASGSSTRRRPSTAAAGRSSAPSATRCTSSADIFRDGHEVLRAVVRWRGPGRAPLARGAADRRSTPTTTACAGRAPSPSTAPGRTQWTIQAWVDLFAGWRDELARKVEAGQPDLAGELSEGVAAAARRGRPRQGRRRARACAAAAERDAPTDPPTRRSAPDAARSSSSASQERTEAHRAARAARGRRRPRARALRLLVRALPALVGRLQGRRRSSSRGSPSSASTSSTCRRSTRSATPTARAATTRSSPARATPAARTRSATRPAATTRSTRSSGTDEDFDALVARRARARHRRRARLRDQVLARPPVADGAPGVVPPPPRRHAQVRREPAQEVPGHLQRQLRTARTGAGCGTRCCDVVRHWVDRGVKVFRVDNPHTKPFAVLGVADPRGPRDRPRRDLPGRGVHAPRGHARAGQDRLHPVLHVLHLEELALGARRSTSTSWPTARSASTSGPTSSSTRRTSSPSTSPHGGPPAFPIRLVLAATLSPSYGIYSGYEHFEHVPARRAPRSTWTPRSTSSSSARSTARCCR